MTKRNGIAAIATLLWVTGMSAQDFHRRAAIVGGEPGRGRCVAEVEVDGVAEIDLRGEGGDIRTLQGRPALWLRLECTGLIPRDPAEFRFEPISGRGRQQLVRPAAEGGPAVIRIDDPQGGAGRYVFEIRWITVRMEERPREGRMEERRREGDVSPVARAIQICQDRVQDRLREDGWRRVEIRSIRVDDQPGRRDWVVGRVSGERREEFRELEFSCNVDLRDGGVRSVDVRPMGERRER